MAAQVQRMRSQIEQLQAELLFYRGDASSPFEELQVYHCVKKVVCDPCLLVSDVY